MLFLALGEMIAPFCIDNAMEYLRLGARRLTFSAWCLET